MRFSFLLLLTLRFLTSQAQPTVGLILNDSTTSQGYVLFGNNEVTYLIDNCGLIVNSWESDYKPGEAIYLLENGNLLRTAQLEGDFDAGGRGGRFELFDWEGNLLWHYEYTTPYLHAHHDLAPLPNGHFLFTAWEKHTEAEAKALGRNTDGEVWSERIVELEILENNEANIAWEWRLWDHLVQDTDPSKPNYGTIAAHPERVNINFIGEEQASGNWIHLNAIDHNADLDQIVVSSRLFSEIWIIDHSTSTAEAANREGGQSGKGGDLLYRFGNPRAYDRGEAADQVLFHQHDVRWIPEPNPYGGYLMVFNNDFQTDQSSVEIWKTPVNETGEYELDELVPFGPNEITKTFTNPDFYSRFMSSAQIISNGHLFVCEGMDGHFFEVNEVNEIVWEYINPVNPNGGPLAQGGTVRFNQTFRATKYPIDYPTFIGRDLQATLPVEINPWENDCFIPLPDSISNIQAEDIVILGNPINHYLEIQAKWLGQDIQMEIINSTGESINNYKIQPGGNTFDFSNQAVGLYFLIFKHRNTLFEVRKIIKL